MQSNLYKRNLFVPFLKMVADVLTVFLAVLAAYYLRFYSPLTQIFPVTKGLPPFEEYLFFAGFLSTVMLLLFGMFYAYRSRFYSKFTQDLPVILKVAFLGILFAMSGAFLYRDFSYSRLVLMIIYLNLNVFLLVERWVFHRLKRKFLRKGFNALRVCLVGSRENLLRIFRRLQSDANYNVEIAGYISEAPLKELEAPHFGPVKNMSELFAGDPAFDAVVISFPAEDHSEILTVIQAAEGKNLELFYVPDVLDLLTPKFQVLEIAGIPLLQLKSFALSGWQGFIKRSFDIILSVLGMLALSPLFLVIGALIKLSSRGPVFYVQPRISLDGNEFNMLKFRSMRVDAEAATGPVWAKKEDPRVTMIGKFLRRSSLDELPQLINVIRGEMSLVGPRPERRHFVDQFQASIPNYIERHRFRCGMTGWAQVNGMRGQSPIEDRTRYDIYYIENWSLWFDLKIIIMTFLEIIRGENAY